MVQKLPEKIGTLCICISPNKLCAVEAMVLQTGIAMQQSSIFVA